MIGASVSSSEAEFSAVNSDADVVLIDSPPSLGFITMGGMAAATSVIVPLTPSFLLSKVQAHLSGEAEVAGLPAGNWKRCALYQRQRIPYLALLTAISQTGRSPDRRLDSDWFNLAYLEQFALTLLRIECRELVRRKDA